MKKKSNKKIKNTNDLEALNNITKNFEIFKSRVASAVLDFMEMQSDSELVECLEKTSVFLNNISFQMENVLDDKDHTFTDQKELFETGDDLFLNNQQAFSNTIH